jgi:hypothetical protein
MGGIVVRILPNSTGSQIFHYLAATKGFSLAVISSHICRLAIIFTAQYASVPYGPALGNARFKQQITKAPGRPVAPLPERRSPLRKPDRRQVSSFCPFYS